MKTSPHVRPQGTQIGRRAGWLCATTLLLNAATAGWATEIGRQVALPERYQDGDEYTLSLQELIRYGEKVFTANWTVEEGAGRPLSKGTGQVLTDPNEPLVFPRNFNRISAPDANSCAGCHNLPIGIAGGNGDVVANVFVLAQRFDFAGLDGTDSTPVRGDADERGEKVNLGTVGNFRATPGMFGSGYIEMLARQVTRELQDIRDSLEPGESKPLTSTGISFGRLSRAADGSWDTSQVEGLAAPSLRGAGPDDPPSLILRPFHQAGNVISLREFSNNAFNHHHGMQSSERFGRDVDADGDGVVNELTRVDITAVSIFQATMPVPGRVIPNNPTIEEAVLIGENRFQQIGCATCHIPSLPLKDQGWIFTEPNPYNPMGNLRPGEAPTLTVDLAGDELPQPRLKPDSSGIVHVPAFTDLKLHDITNGPGDPNYEPLDMNQPPGSPEFFAGNGRFLTRKLWGAGNKPNYYHHGLYTTLREAILAHSGDAREEREAFAALTAHEQNCVIEFLKTLQVLPAGAPGLVVDETGAPKSWPPQRLTGISLTEEAAIVQWSSASSLFGGELSYQVQRCLVLGEEWENVGPVLRHPPFIDPLPGRAAFYRIMVSEPRE